MAATTLAVFRQQRLNVDLGLDLTSGTSGDGDNSLGTTTVRTQAIKVAFARLWPHMARLVIQSVATVASQLDYTLTAIRDVETIEQLDASTGYVTRDDIRNFRNLYDETTAGTEVRRLRLPAAPLTATTSTLRVIGYQPYKSEFTGDSDTLDIPVELEWIPTIGARMEVYRRQLNKRANYEQFANLSRDTDVTVAELRSMYLDARAEFLEAISDHRRDFKVGHRARFTPA